MENHIGVVFLFKGLQGLAFKVALKISKIVTVINRPIVIKA